jgi:alkanesulfonate monooxygenase SsuD/methylene tetrahydromethanopterin reductase-like flavin-dependent oxidoreductase (luciferase family)
VAGADLFDEAGDVVEVVRRLWDSWEDDAVIRDVATGRYIDVDKLHYVDFETPADFAGTPYSVKGPSIIPRPLQGQLPVLAAASLVGEGLVPADAVDAVLVSAPTAELLAAEIRDVRTRLGAAVAVVAELDVVLDSRGQDAGARLVASTDSGRARFAGSAAGLTELLDSLLREADGVRVHPAEVDVDLEELSRLVLPELRRRGSLREPIQDGSFRDVLGLGPAENRYSTSAAATAAGK